MKNIAVLVSGGGTNLQAIIDAEKKGTIKSGKVRLVLSSGADAFALTRAKENDIPTLVVDRKQYKSRAEFTEAVCNALTERNIDLIVLAGFMYILGERFTNTFENRIINVHPALIPSFCGDGYYGLKVHEAVLQRGVKYTGATVHFVNEVTDGGPIILQKAIRVKKNDTPKSLQRRVMEKAEWIILPQAIELFCADELKITGNTVTI